MIVQNLETICDLTNAEPDAAWFRDRSSLQATIRFRFLLRKKPLQLAVKRPVSRSKLIVRISVHSYYLLINGTEVRVAWGRH